MNTQGARVRNAFPSEDAFQEFLKRLHMSDTEFQELMRREVRVDLLMGEQMRVSPISDEELDRALQDNAALKALAAAQGRSRAREAMLQRRAEDHAYEYVEGLKKQTSIKVVARFGPAPTRPAAP